MKTITKKPVVKKFKTITQQLVEIIDKHIVTTTAIVKDYEFMSEAGLELELTTANENLKQAVEDFDNETDAEKFKRLIEELSFVHKRDFDADKIIELLDDKDYNSEALIKMLDTRDVESYFVNEGYACIKINNLADRQKLEEFVTTQIYPSYHDQQSFLIL